MQGQQEDIHIKGKQSQLNHPKQSSNQYLRRLAKYGLGVATLRETLKETPRFIWQENTTNL